MGNDNQGKKNDQKHKLFEDSGRSLPTTSTSTTMPPVKSPKKSAQANKK